MASKRRQRRNSCEGKIRYEKIDTAWAKVRKIDPKMKPYRCNFCSGFHVGYEPGKQKRRRTMHA